MNLSISNIAWSKEDDQTVYAKMKACGFSGLEIAPTRIFPQNPYDHLQDAKEWAVSLKERYGFSISSMQSIWFGCTGRIFGTIEERVALLEYTKKAILFAELVGCGNLVFGCPRNRCWQQGDDLSVAVGFFKEIGEFAKDHHTVIGMEANPPIYNTNYINSTKSALELIELVGSDGFMLNLDVGTMIYNRESVSLLERHIHKVNHVHISQPHLVPVEKNVLHSELADFLKSNSYHGFVSIEMGKQEDISVAMQAMEYVATIFA